MNNFKITIAITTYNRNDFLKEAIQSILQQTHQDFHILIVTNRFFRGFCVNYCA